MAKEFLTHEKASLLFFEKGKKYFAYEYSIKEILYLHQQHLRQPLSFWAVEMMELHFLVFEVRMVFVWGSVMENFRLIFAVYEV